MNALPVKHVRQICGTECSRIVTQTISLVGDSVSSPFLYLSPEETMNIKCGKVSCESAPLRKKVRRATQYVVAMII